MAEVLEWFQCKGCGRRHRWRADIAGRNIQCSCGGTVLCPEVDVSDASRSPHDTLVETADSEDSAFGASFKAQPAAAGDDTYSPPVRMGRGLFGLSVQGEFVFWSVMALLGLSMLIHAIITQFWWYIALAVLIAPLSFWMFNRARRIWQGPRSFMKAVEQSLGG